jgi:PAS domain S-box-containing protein
MGDAALSRRVLAANVEPHWSEVLDAVPGLAFVGDPTGENLFTNRYFQQFTGLGAQQLLGEGWVETIHPDDRQRAAAAWRHAVETTAFYDEEYRFVGASGECRWFRCRATPTVDMDGKVVRWVGVAFDVHRRRLAEDLRDTVIAELSHRTKNLLTIVQAVAELTARSVNDKAEFRSVFSARLAALDRVNDQLVSADWTSLPLGQLVESEVTPFGDDVRARVLAGGPELQVPAGKGPTVVLILHELLTNALKYGALSVPEGRVELAWARQGDLATVSWREFGGPTISTPPERRGFGTRLIQTVTARDLAWPAEFRFEPDGVRCSFAFKLARS